jgi:hypothetical protein
MYYHADAGVRRTADLYVTRDKAVGTVDVRVTGYSGDSLETLFTGRTRLQDASEEKPYGGGP